MDFGFLFKQNVATAVSTNNKIKIDVCQIIHLHSMECKDSTAIKFSKEKHHMVNCDYTKKKKSSRFPQNGENTKPHYFR